ncbi:MAG: TetR/AcrR family transcriptional regulator [Bacteroidota bacterium]
MGRKAKDKARKNDPKRRTALAAQLIPMLQQRGLQGLTMDELAQMLGKSKATIYKYFRTREELFDLALTLKLERIRGFVPILNDRERPYLERYYEAIQHLSTHLSDISNLFLRDLRDHFPALWQKIEMLQDFAAMILRAYYAEGVEAGLLRDIHPGILVMSDRFLFQALSDPAFLEANDLRIHDAFEQYFQMKFFGLVEADERQKNAESGNKMLN